MWQTWISKRRSIPPLSSQDFQGMTTARIKPSLLATKVLPCPLENSSTAAWRISTACLPAIGKPPVLGLCFQSKKWEPTALSAPMISKGKTYHRQNILCAAGSQICEEGLRHVPDRPTSHRFCIRVPTRRFRAAALTCGGTCLRASRVTRPGFPAPPRDLPRARRSCRRYRPCACDAR